MQSKIYFKKIHLYVSRLKHSLKDKLEVIYAKYQVQIHKWISLKNPFIKETKRHTSLSKLSNSAKTSSSSSADSCSPRAAFISFNHNRNCKLKTSKIEIEGDEKK